MKRIVSYKIEYCNARCPHFYHNYADKENMWCSELNKKIFDFNIADTIFFDHTERSFPEYCPLKWE